MRPADLTAEANPIIGDTDPDTARRLQAVLTGMNLRAQRHLIDILIDTVAPPSSPRHQQPRSIDRSRLPGRCQCPAEVLADLTRPRAMPASGA
jgi:hypothetical protein